MGTCKVFICSTFILIVYNHNRDHVHIHSTLGKVARVIDTCIFWLLPFFFSLEERQRAEKRARETKGHQFTPKWFEPSSDIFTTPWGDVEVYRNNGKYAEHRAAIDSSDSIEEVDVKSIEFNPWQYEDLTAE